MAATLLLGQIEKARLPHQMEQCYPIWGICVKLCGFRNLDSLAHMSARIAVIPCLLGVGRSAGAVAS